jgi:hypothetical protein
MRNLSPDFDLLLLLISGKAGEGDGLREICV